MKTSLNQAGPPPTWACPYEIEVFIEAAAKGGFEGVELRFPNIENYLRKKSIQDLLDLLVSYNLGVATINHIDSPDFLSKRMLMKFLDKVRRKMEICRKLNCDKIVVCPSKLPSPNINRKVIIEKCSTSLRKLASLGVEYGVKIAFEPLVRDIVDGKVYTFAIDTCEKYKDLLKAVGSENIGLTIDTFHFYIGDMINEIESITNILIVHVSDAKRDVPFKKLTDYPHRVFPGEGVINFSLITQALKKNEYNGYLSVEVFYPPYWKLSPIEFARKARRSLDRLLE